MPPAAAPSVVLADDDPAARRDLAAALRQAGQRVLPVADGAAALDAVSDGAAAVLVLETSMPVLGGVDVCRLLRQEGHELPIVLVSTGGAVADRVAGLDAGADDYLVKPVAAEELLARIRAVRRRLDQPRSQVLRVADLVVDPEAHRASRGGQDLELTPTELRLLVVLARDAGRVCSREQLYEEVWGYGPELASNSLEVYVGYLRRKMEADGRARLLHTVRGVGYVLREP